MSYKSPVPKTALNANFLLFVNDKPQSIETGSTRIKKSVKILKPPITLSTTVKSMHLPGNAIFQVFFYGVQLKR